MNQHLSFLIVATTLWPALAAQNPPGTLPTGERIEILQGPSWKRGAVANDPGPSSATMKVRLDPNNVLLIVPRKAVRLAPRPTSIKVGDRVEWYGDSNTSFTYVTATVKEVGTGNWQGYYLMAWDKYPNSPKYTKPDHLWLLPESNTSDNATAAPDPGGPKPGKYRCYAYGATGAPPLFLGAIELAAGGTYSVNGKPGRYRYDASTHAITWLDGWAKENGFAGSVEGNALLRLRRNTICSHE